MICAEIIRFRLRALGSGEPRNSQGGLQMGELFIVVALRAKKGKEDELRRD